MPAALDGLLHVFLATSLVVALAVCADPFTRRLGVEGTPLERSIVSAGIGLAVLASVASVACLLGFFRPSFAWGVWIALVVAAGARFRDLKATWILTKSAVRRKWAGADLLAKGLVVLCAMLTASALFIALAPPDASDAGQYHLGLAKLFTLVGGYEHHPTWLRSGFSLNATMLYGFEMLLHPRDSVGMCWVLWVLEGIALVAYGNRWFGKGAGYWTVPFWLAVGVTYAPASGFAEGFLTLQWVLAAHVFGLWLERGNRGALLLSGLFIGTAAGTKPSGLVALGVWLTLLPTATYLWPRIRPMPARTFRWLGAAAAIAMVAGSPWYIRNWVFEHNPVFPALASVFGSAELVEMGGAPWEMWGEVHRSVSGFFLAPLRASYDPPGWQGNTTAWVEWTVGPWAVAFIPAFLLLHRPGRVVWFLIAWSYLQACIWYIPSGGHGRHLYPFLETVAPAAGAVVAWLRTRSPVEKFPAYALILVAALPIWGLTLARGAIYAKVVVGAQSRDSFLSERMPDAYSAISYLNRSLDPSQRVLLVDAGVSGALLNVRWIYGFPRYMQNNFDPRDWNSPEDFFRKMGAFEITHVWFRGEIFGDKPHEVKSAYQRFLDCCTTKLHDTKTIDVYRINFPKEGA